MQCLPNLLTIQTTPLGSCFVACPVEVESIQYHHLKLVQMLKLMTSQHIKRLWKFIIHIMRVCGDSRIGTKASWFALIKEGWVALVFIVVRREDSSTTEKVRVGINLVILKAETLCLEFLFSLSRCKAKCGQSLKSVGGQTSTMRPDSLSAPPVVGGSSSSQSLPPWYLSFLFLPFYLDRSSEKFSANFLSK